MVEDELLMHLLRSQQKAIADMLAHQARRTAGHDLARLGSNAASVVYSRNGAVSWTAQAELIGVLMTDVDRFRWWWVMPHADLAGHARLNAAYALGQQRGIPTLTSRTPGITTDREARVLAELCACLSGACGVHAEREEDRISYYALFDSTGPTPPSTIPPDSGRPAPVRPPTARSVTPPSSFATLFPPPPPSARASSTPHSAPDSRVGTEIDLPHAQPVSPVRSLRPADLEAALRPPALPGDQRAAKAVMPGRELVRHLAHEVNLALVAQCPSFRQAVAVVELDVREGKGRFSVHLVASRADGELVVLDATAGVMAAAVELIREDAKQGNGRWRRLTVRLGAGSAGVSIRADIKV